LEQVAEWLTRVTPVRTTAELCVRARSGRAACQACVDLCPEQAVSLGRGPTVVSDRCTACGLCAAACPTGAIRLEEPSAGSLLAGARKLAGDPLICACPGETAALSQAHPGQVLPVPCIGALTYELLTALLSTGHQTVVLWQPERCRTCAKGAGAERLARAAAAAVSEFCPGRVVLTGAHSALTAGGSAGAGAVLDEALVARDRRAFLGSMLKGGAGGLTTLLLGDWFRPPVKAAPPRQTLHDVTAPSRRRELLEQVLGAVTADRSALLPERAVTVTAVCTLCPVCTKLCPSGALRRTESGDGAALAWQAAACTGCGLCRATCPVGAVREGERLSVERFLATEPEVLVTGSAASCTCGQPYWRVAGGQELCIACRMRSGGWE
jgi:ferredoxin